MSGNDVHLNEMEPGSLLPGDCKMSSLQDQGSEPVTGVIAQVPKSGSEGDTMPTTRTRENFCGIPSVNSENRSAISGRLSPFGNRAPSTRISQDDATS